MTKCLNCGRVLTTDAGERIASANYDSALPGFGSVENVRLGTRTGWARCDECYQAAWPMVQLAQSPRPAVPRDDYGPDDAYRPGESRVGGVEHIPCQDNTHPFHYLCVKPDGHDGKHRAEFADDSTVVEW